MKGLRVEIYKPHYGDCSNNGITARCKYITLIGPGIVELDEPTEDAPACKIVLREFICGKKVDYMHIEPIERPTGAGWMFGGCIGCTSDSRFPSKYPLKIHDRQEFSGVMGD